jgi:hypothetical protein
MIMYDLNRKHTNFQLNWIEDVAYTNITIFSTKFKTPSRLRVRCLRSQIWASSYGGLLAFCFDLNECFSFRFE